MELPAGVRNEPRHVAHALEVSQVQGTTLELERPVVSLAHALQLVSGCTGSVDVACRDLDLDLRLEQRRSLQLCVRW
jgi:hypothetical protein